MSDVKPPDGLTYRQWQALQTKRRIARAARVLFASGGYAETSIEAVAREAGVAARTVYASLGGKKQMLAMICDEWLAESGVAEIAAEIMGTHDPRKRLNLIAHLNRRQWELGHDVVPMLEAAASSDPDVERMLNGWKQQRAGMVGGAVRGIASRLRAGVEEDWAVATVLALSSPGVFDELVGGLGWSAGRYEEWLGDLFSDLLL